MKGIDTKLCDVVCVSPRNHMVFTPLLFSTCVGTLEFWSVSEPIGKIQPAIPKEPGSYFFLGTCIGVNVDNYPAKIWRWGSAIRCCLRSSAAAAVCLSSLAFLLCRLCPLLFSFHQRLARVLFQGYRCLIKFQLLYLQRDEGIKLVVEAICFGIFNDLGSGSNVGVCVITKVLVAAMRGFKPS